MPTALQLVNKVLRRLREDEATTFTTSYTNLILDFVNEAKREVEDAWNWTALRTTISINTVAGTRTYSLTGAGSRFRILQDESFRPMVYNATTGAQLNLARGSVIAVNDLDTTNSGSPQYFTFVGQDSSGDPIVSFEGIPDAVETIRFHLHVPQADLSATTDTLTVPEWPVVMGAWSKAISERGEDGGQNTIEQQLMYRSALSDAIAIDESRVFEETTWQQA